MSRIKVVLFFLLTTVIFYNCTPPDPPNHPGSVTPTPAPSPTEEPEYINRIFEKDEETGIVYFETNDPEYWSEDGYTLWIVYENDEEVFTSRQVLLSKQSGDARAGYGMVYCYRNDEETGRTMLVVLINTEKEYIVAETQEADFHPIIPWTESLFLHPGYNQQNRVRLEYDSEEELFSLYINNQLETTFRDEEEPVHTSGWHGYIVVISPHDDFPDVPVKIQFKEEQE